MLVAESMPPTSEQLPLLSIYYAVTIGIVSLSSAMAVLTLNINNKGNKGRKVPRIIRIIFFNYLAKLLRTELKNEYMAYKPLKKWKEYEIKSKDSNNARKNKRLTSINPNVFNQGLNDVNLSVLDVHKNADAAAKKANSGNSIKIKLENKKKKPELNENKVGETVNVPIENEKYDLIDQIVFKSSKSSKGLANNSDRIVAHIQNNNNNNNETPKLSRKLANLPRKQTEDHFNRNNSNYCVSNSSMMKNETVFSSFYYGSPNLDEFSTSPNRLAKRSRENKSIEFLNELEKILAKQFNPLIVTLTKTLNQAQVEKEEREKYEVIQNEWSDVAMIMDHILCYLFFIVTIVSCLVIFTNSPLFFSQW
jgi:hypothetical protein